MTGQQKDSNQLQSKQINNFLLSYFNLIVLAVVIIILLAGYFWILAPKYKRISVELANATETQSETYNKEKDYLDKLIKLNDKFNSLPEAEIKKIDALLPGQPDIEKLMSQLEILAARNGVFLASLKIASVDAGNKENSAAAKQSKRPLPAGVVSARISMKLAGVTYGSLKSTLRDFESSLRLFDIEDVTFAPGGNAAELTVTTYNLQTQGDPSKK